MTQPIARDALYRRRVFDAEIIELCVRWYISYRLSYRDLLEMMAERGVKVAHTTMESLCQVRGIAASPQALFRKALASWRRAFRDE